MANCVICKTGEYHSGKVTVTLQRDECTIIFKSVPAEVCDNCGEYALTETISQQLLERAEAAVQLGAEVEILQFAA